MSRFRIMIAEIYHYILSETFLIFVYFENVNDFKL